MTTLASFAGQNWTIEPVASIAPGIPGAIDDHLWSVTLSGVVIADLVGTGSKWRRDTVRILPDIQNPLANAGKQLGIDLPPAPGVDTVFHYALQMKQWAPFVAPSSMFNKSHAINSGYAVDAWRPAPFWTGTDSRDGQKHSRLFNGIVVDIGVSDSDGILHRLAYNFHLIGTIVVVTIGPGFPGPSWKSP